MNLAQQSADILVKSRILADSSTLPSYEKVCALNIITEALGYLATGTDEPPLDYEGGTPRIVAMAHELIVLRHRRGAVLEAERRAMVRAEKDT